MMKSRNAIRTCMAMTAIIALSGSFAFAVPTPVHEYRFGGDGADSAGIADGTPGSNTAFTSAGVPAGLGRAMVVGTNGTHPNNVINVPNADFIDFGIGDFSIAFWVRRDNADSGNVDGICDALSGTGRGWEVFFTSTDTLKVRLDDDNGNTAQYDSTTIFADTLWHHVLIRVDRDDAAGLVMYIDGAFDSAHDPTAISANIDPNQNLWIGGHNDSNSQGLEGELALLQIFDSALTAIDAVHLSAIGFPIHQYDFEADALDSAGTADGTVGVNVTFNSVDVPVELGQAAVFGNDGSIADNRIDVPLASFTDFGLGDFSISIWVKRDQNSGTTQGIFDNLAADGTQLQFLGNDILRARIDDDLGNEFRPESLTTMTDLGWHHLLLTIDRDAVDGAKWFIDGQLDSSSDPTVLSGSVLADQNLRIGTINALGLRGQLAQLTFYDAALSANDAFDLADLDRDGVPYVLDACLDFDDNLDADADAVPDACDNCPGDANMDQMDSDSDGAGDACDICPGFDDTLDDDADGVPDGCDICPGFNDNLDADADGVPDDCDICPNDADFDQLDTDMDGAGDVCDLCPGFDDTLDADADGVPDGCDACNGFDDSLDGDGDGLADDCDACTGASQTDSDADGICDEFDACAGDDALCTVPANVICVWAMAPGAQDGSNWFNAYRDLSAALAAAMPGDEVWVAASTYYPDGGYRPTGGQLTAGTGSRGLSFQLESGVAIYGGFLGNESMREQRDWETNVTVLSGDIDGDDALDGNSRHVVQGGGNDDPTAQLDGFTITAGYANGSLDEDSGAGMFNRGSPTISNCVFRENSTVNGDGGGLYNEGSPTLLRCDFLENRCTGSIATLRTGAGLYTGGSGHATLIDCTFVDNRSISSVGGGVRNVASLTLIRCTFLDNRASGSLGGAIYNQRNLFVTDCVFNGNIASRGAAIFDFGNLTRIVNTTFSGNTAGTYGGAVYIDDSSMHMTNTTISGNSAGNAGGGIYILDGDLTLRNGVLWGNSDNGGMDESAQIHVDDGDAAVNHSIVQGGWTGVGANNLNADPLFADADGADDLLGTADDDLTILTGSPCINAGDNIAVPLDVYLDLAGNPRFNDCMVDLGAFEFASPAPVDSDGDGFTDDCDACPGADDRPDRDADGAADNCEICAGASESDADGDGVCDEFDACAGDDAGCVLPANVLCVWPLAPGLENGSNWFNAFRNLRSALAAAQPGDEIWVAAGTYFPDGGYQAADGHFIPGNGERDLSFDMQPDVAVYGGFVGNESARSERDANANVTILSGEIDGNDLLSNNSIRVVNAGPSVGPTARLEGFTITRGFAIRSISINAGAGMFITGSPTVYDCSFIANSADQQGGGMYIDNGSPTIQACRFEANFSDSSLGGGAIYVNDGTPTLTDCSFSENSARQSGGGMYISRGSTTLTDCSFDGNSAGYEGGAMFTSLASFDLTNCSFIGNTADDRGGAVYNYNISASRTLDQCVFNGNSAGQGGGAIYNESASPILDQCVFSGNIANDTGGAMYNASSSPILDHCVFSGNSATDDGGGMFNAGASPMLTHCVFIGNSVSDNGGGMYNNNSSPILANCILWGNSDSGAPDQSAQVFTQSGTPVIDHSDVQGGWTGAGANNINADPLFTDADGPDNIPRTEDDDLTLLAGSPCIDAGDNGAIPAGLFTDLAGNIRRVDDPITSDTGIGLCAIVDMGPYEFQAGGVADSDGDGVCDPDDICPGFDDNLDTDADDQPDGCDACPTTILGDVNGDTFIDATDIPPFAAVLLNPTGATPDERCAADVDNNNVVDGLDVQALVDLMLAP